MQLSQEGYVVGVQVSDIAEFLFEYADFLLRSVPFPHHKFYETIQVLLPFGHHFCLFLIVDDAVVHIVFGQFVLLPRQVCLNGLEFPLEIIDDIGSLLVAY